VLRTVGLSTLGLVLAAGVPFAYYSLSDYCKTSPAVTSAIAGMNDSVRSLQQSSRNDPAPLDLSSDGTPIQRLADVIRFDVTPTWILGQWPRVSTGLGQLQLQGYRVPLVTGTAEDDLAGALTYYFNPHQQVQRIAFYGSTGNPGKLLALLNARFGFVRRLVNDPGLLLYEVPERGGPPQSTLRIESAQIIRASDPYHRYTVSLLIERK
jgi:hypothetical protein